MRSKELFLRLLSYSWRYWPAFLVTVLAMSAAAGAETAFPAMMKTLMDEGFSKTESFNLFWVPVVILLIFLTRGSASFVANYSMHWLSQNVLRDLRKELFDKLLRMPTSAYDELSTGSLISKLINDAQQVLMAATNVVTAIIRDSLLLVGLLGWLLWINWKLTLVVVVLLPPLGVLTRKFSERMRRVSSNYLSTVGDMTTSVEEAVVGNKVIKIFGAQVYEQERFEKVNQSHRAQGMRLAVASSLQSPVTQLIASIGVAAILTIALMQARTGQASIGDFVSFITAMIMMLNPIRHLSELNSQLQRGLAAAEGLFSFLDKKNEPDLGTYVFTQCKGDITFKNVTFSYRTRETPALKNFSLQVPAGKTFALVGPSGSGKTTLINLLARLYEIDSGEIAIDGVNIKSVTLKSLREQLSVVSQDVILFNDTIEANIRYGENSISYEDVRAAAEAADLMDFVNSLPNGLKTSVGDKGVLLSGGQRQRIAIARAIVKDSPILLLDEATAALDNRTESKVQTAIETLRKGKTTLTIAHRLSTVIDADQVIVMESGEIVQQGRHKDLIETAGLYQSFYSQSLIS